jgi:hypothetical protein
MPIHESHSSRSEQRIKQQHRTIISQKMSEPAPAKLL